VVLPPLLYAASEELPWRDLRVVWRPVAVLAVGLVLASAAAGAAATWAVAAVPASMAFVLGVVLASADPVAVSTLGRRLSLPAKVQALVQAESLFNDATSLVPFRRRGRPPAPASMIAVRMDRELRRDLNAAEHAELARLYDDGTISQAARQQLQRSLDLEAARLSEPR
jgi:Sodium/hydrogen exchanger family